MVSLVDVLALPALALRPTHAVDPDAAVRWVATSELDDPAPFLEGGELLLTTGLAARGWRREWDGYVERLVARGICALGLATGLTHARPPVGLVRACERHHLNLIEVPHDTPFVAVSRAIADLLEEEDRREARDASRYQRELITAALDAHDGSAVPRRLAGLLRGAAAVLAPDGTLLVDPSGPRSDDLDLASLTAELARIRPRGLRAASAVATSDAAVELHPIGVRTRPSAYLAVLLPAGAGEARRSAVRTAVALLGLAGERAAERRDADRALRARALALFLAGDSHGAVLVLGAASRPVVVPERVCVVLSRPSVAAGAVRTGLSDLLEAVEDDGLMISGEDDGLVALVAPDRAEALAADAVAAGARVGIGEPVALEDVAAGHRTAGHALARTADGAPVVAWEQVMHTGILGLLEPDRAADFAHTLLAPLAASPELRATLLAFLSHHGSRLKVAEELGVHRNTVRHRIQQVEMLTGLHLDDAEHRVRAWIALQALPAPEPVQPR